MLQALEMPDSGGVSQTRLAFARILDKGGLRMTCEFVITLVTCVATVVSTVIALLSYLKDKE